MITLDKKRPYKLKDIIRKFKTDDYDLKILGSEVTILCNSPSIMHRNYLVFSNFENAVKIDFDILHKDAHLNDWIVMIDSVSFKRKRG